MNKPFVLDTQLSTTSFFVHDFKVAQCRLMDNAYYPWLLLIPRVPDAIELIDLPLQMQHDFLDELNEAARVLRSIVVCDKLNIATLGNYVRQLHIHVIARTTSDRAWPKPVWGGEQIAYATDAREWLILKLRETLSTSL